MRRGTTGLIAGVAGLGLFLAPAPRTADAAQTAPQQTSATQVAGPQTALPAPAPANAPTAAVAAPTPASTQPTAAPVPTPEGQDKIESMPGYVQRPAKAQRSGGATPEPGNAPAAGAPSGPAAQVPYTAMPAYGTVEKSRDTLGSVYIPVDSWVYPEVLRLYSLGYADTAYLSMRPYTRRSLLHILQASEAAILASGNEQAQEILAALLAYLTSEGVTEGTERGTVYGVQNVYTRMLGVTGPILTDSFHLGQTFYNDYGRPLETGFNNSTGFTTVNEQGPFSLFVRAEYQHAPAATGYSQALSQQISLLDEIPFSGYNDPQSTIPTGPIAAQNPFRIVEASLSYHLLGHEISLGKSDAWLGPGMGGSMTWSDNAENIYSFRIDRIEPINIKYLSRFLGPVRYDFFYGSLKGHTDPNDDWVHSEIFSFAPTKNFQFGFQRTIIFGGAGHEPVTLRTFLKGFFDTNDTNAAEKLSRNDPGARFSSFHFSYRLPFVRNYLTLYTDSETHDDLTPVSAPRRAAYRPGIYLSQFPGARRLSLRVEAVSTDCSTLICQRGSNEYIEEAIQKQGYTNKGNIMADWIGREAKGGQAWLTWHLSGDEWADVQYMHKQTPGDFIPGAYNAATNTYGPGGTTQNQFRVDVMKRITPNFEIYGWYQYERWVAPIYMPGVQHDNTMTVQVKFYPKLQSKAP